MSEITPVLQLPLMQAAQAQKHVTHNEALEKLDVICQLRVEGFGAETPPASPIEGQAWVLGTSPTGDWAGEGGKVVSYRNGGWLFLPPRIGWLAWSKPDDQLRAYDGANWIVLGGTPDFQNLSGLGINASYDNTNKLAVAADATLFNHDGAGHQLKLNKSGTGDTASLLYQSGFSGRAELGLAGEEDFSLKVSADGSTWFSALRAEAGTGRVGIEEVLNLPPRAEPGTAVAGDVYFDGATSKLRCFDGTAWQDLF